MGAQRTSTANQKNTVAHRPQPKPTTSPIASAAKCSPAASITTSGLPSSADLLLLQRTIGNRAVSRLIQTKLAVGPASDHYEQEADQVAAQVMAMQVSPMSASAPAASTMQRQTEEEEIQAKPLAAAITPLVQREATPEEEEIQTKPIVQRAPEEEEELQAKPAVQRAASGAGFEVSGEFEQQLAANRGGGNPLPDEVRSFMEPRFGSDFSGVRIHTGGESAQLNRSVSAQAFTHGSDIYLGEGKTDVESAQGKQLLAHELTHVVQQTGHVSRRIQRLWSEQELLARAGKPKSNVLFHKMSEKYKSILAEVGRYDNYLSPAPSYRRAEGKDYAETGKEFLDRIHQASTTYLAAHKATQKRTRVIRDLVNQIGPERTALDKVAVHYDFLQDFHSGRYAVFYAASMSATAAPVAPPVAAPVAAPVAPPIAAPVAPPIAAPPLASTAPATGGAGPARPLPLLPSDPYMERIRQSAGGTGVPAGPGGFKWLSQHGKDIGTSLKIDPTSLTAHPGGFGQLTQAELTAIQIYTAPDFRYINPALENSESYLRNTFPDAAGVAAGKKPAEILSNMGWSDPVHQEIQDRLNADPKQLLKEMAKEGEQHSNMAIQGLKKLPKISGTYKRGETRTKDDYEKRYKVGNVLPRKSFTSVAKNPSVADHFCNSPAGSPEFGVLITMNLTDGRDIQAINVYGEAEILLLPGAEFTVKQVESITQPTYGGTPLNVTLDQTK